MSNTNPAPAAGNDDPLSFDDGVEALTDLMPDPETDLKEEDQGQQEATRKEPHDPGPNEEDFEVKDDEEDTEADTEEEAAEQEEDGPQEVAAGKFAADTANVRLKDGSVISVQDLKRGYLSQASFTRGTQENAKERETLASQKAEVEQYARTLQQHRDFLLQASQHFIPQQPDRALLDRSSPNYDPITYAALKADYDDRIAMLGQLQQVSQSELDRASKEQQRQQKELRATEAKRLLDVMPELKKPEVYNKFWQEAVETMSEYGFSNEDLDQIHDHRFYVAMRDLASYRRARQKLPAVKESIKTKPVLTGQRRMDTKEKSSREKQARTEQLRKTGDFDAGVKALMDLDL